MVATGDRRSRTIPLAMMTIHTTSAMVAIVHQLMRNARSTYVEQLDVEHERRPGRDQGRKAARAVPYLGRDGERATTADFHPGDALVPALDDLPRAQHELKRLVPIARRIELRPVGQRARVVHGDA